MNRTDELKAHKRFLAEGMTVAGSCGLIANLEAESDGFYPHRVEYLCLMRLKENGIKDAAGKDYTHETYTKAVDSGRITRAKFLNPLPSRQYGYGLAQWTTPARKAELYDLVKSRGVSICDLDIALDYLMYELKNKFPSVLKVLKTATTIKEASDIVLVKFEAPAGAEAMKASRAKRGQDFYDYIKKEETKMAVSVVLSGHGSGKPSTKGLNAYCSSRQAAGRGLVEVRRLPGITDAIRKAMHDYYQSILGRNIYSQSLRDYCYSPYKGTYYSDCSSSICRTAQKAGVSGVASLNTAGMHYNWTKVSGVVISNGIIQNPEILKVGDALMFKGSDPSRPLQIGHTEMVYEINGTAAAAANPTASTGESVVAAGQMHANNFTDAGLAVDGERGALTKKAGNKVLQTAINLDYGTGLEVDGDWGSKSDKGLTGHYTRKGETQYMVTALEILLMLKGYNPNGVECPGVFGSGLEVTVRKYQADHGLVVDGVAGYNTYKSLIS